MAKTTLPPETWEAKIRDWSLTYQATYKANAARLERLPPDAFRDLPYATWAQCRAFYAKRFDEVAREVDAEWSARGVTYMDLSVFRIRMGYDMKPRIKSEKRLLALPWPDEVHVLAAEDVNGYCESLGGGKHLWYWIEDVFDIGTEAGRECHDQFLYVLYDVMREHCDTRDRDRICISAVPTTENYQITASPYTAGEVAEWWNEALRRVGYDVF